MRPLSVMSVAQRTMCSVNRTAALRFYFDGSNGSNSVAAHRFRVVMAVGLALVALLLAAMGYGGVRNPCLWRTQRTFEIGIRMAFGAERFVIML